MGQTLTPWQWPWVDPDNDQDKEPDTDLSKEETELHNVNFFTQIISVQLNLPQEKANKLREVFDI